MGVDHNFKNINFKIKNRDADHHKELHLLLFCEF